MVTIVIAVVIWGEWRTQDRRGIVKRSSFRCGRPKSCLVFLQTQTEGTGHDFLGILDTLVLPNRHSITGFIPITFTITHSVVQ